MAIRRFSEKKLTGEVLYRILASDLGLEIEHTPVECRRCNMQCFGCLANRPVVSDRVQVGEDGRRLQAPGRGLERLGRSTRSLALGRVGFVGEFAGHG